MFDSLTSRLGDVFDKLTRRGSLGESDVTAALREVRVALLEAGEPVLRVPTLGGSLPLSLFAEILERPLIILPIANHDNNQHAPDENLRLANLWYGIDLMAALITMD